MLLLVLLRLWLSVVVYTVDAAVTEDFFAVVTLFAVGIVSLIVPGPTIANDDGLAVVLVVAAVVVFAER